MLRSIASSGIRRLSELNERVQCACARVWLRGFFFFRKSKLCRLQPLEVVQEDLYPSSLGLVAPKFSQMSIITLERCRWVGSCRCCKTYLTNS